MLIPLCRQHQSAHSAVYNLWQEQQWTHTRNHFTAFFRDHLGEPVSGENIWTLWCKGRLTEADTPAIRLGATPSGLTSAHLNHPHPIFFTGRMPFLPPNEQRQSTEGSEHRITNNENAESTDRGLSVPEHHSFGQSPAAIASHLQTNRFDWRQTQLLHRASLYRTCGKNIYRYSCV